MTYIRFLLKQMTKNLLSYIPVTLILICCLGTLFLNKRNYLVNNAGVYARQNLVENMKHLERAKQKLEKTDQNSPDYDAVLESIELGESEVAFYKKLAEAYENEKWAEVYDLEIELSHKLKGSLDYSENSEVFKAAVDRDLAKYEALAVLDLAYEDEVFTWTAAQFTLSLFRYILPALLPLGLAYILTNLYGSAFAGNLDKNRLLPRSLLSITLGNIFAGVFYALLTLLAILLPVTLVSGVVYGWGNPAYPIMFYHLASKEMYFSAIGQVIAPTILLHALSLVFVAILIYLITLLTKNKMTALFVSTIVLLSGIVLPSVLAPVSAVAQWLPLTYSRSFDITTGVFQHSIDNYQVSTSLGVLVLSLSSLVLTLICLLVQKAPK